MSVHVWLDSMGSTASIVGAKHNIDLDQDALLSTFACSTARVSLLLKDKVRELLAMPPRLDEPRVVHCIPA
jgi:hypothetical protein